MEKVSKKIIDAENTLTEERIQQLLSTTPITAENRPRESLRDLMWWVKDKYGKELVSLFNDATIDDIVPVINNAIGIEGAFLHYCSIKDIVIKPLLIDSISSWNTQTNTESFMIQGVFLITCNEFSFIHCALFHKGNQYEDEISYFVLVSRRDYMKYVKFRNEFVTWETKRTNQALEVKVVGGDDYTYTPTNKWSDVFLPAELKGEIKSSMDAFLGAKNKYAKNKLPWKRGILLHGPQGNGKTTLIHTFISEYDLKPVTVSEIDDNTLGEAFTYAEQNSPAILFIEDVDGIFKEGQVSPRRFLNIIDGLKALDGVVIVLTTNFPKKLPRNLIDRRSRLDRLWEIPYPDNNMAFKFLRRWFKPSLIKDDPLSAIVKIATDNDFSYADLKEVYISSMFSAMAKNREQPNIDDLNEALTLIIREKKNVTDGFESTGSGKKSRKFGFSASKG